MHVLSHGCRAAVLLCNCAITCLKHWRMALAESLSRAKAAHPQGSHAHVSMGGPDQPRGLGVIELQVLPHSCRCCIIQIVCVNPPNAIHLQEESMTHEKAACPTAERRCLSGSADVGAAQGMQVQNGFAAARQVPLVGRLGLRLWVVFVVMTE